MSQEPPKPDGEDESPALWRETWPPQSYWARVTITAVLVLASAGLIWTLRSVLLILVASLVLAIGLQPSIKWFERRGWSRGWSLAALLISGLVVFGGLAAVLIPFIAGQVAELIDGLPEFLERLEDAPSFVGRIVELTGIDALVGDGTASNGGSSIDPLQALTDLGGTVFNILTVLVVTPYFALEYPSIKNWAVRLLRPAHRQDFLRVLGDSTDLIANYIVGNLAISIIAGLVSFIGFWALDVRFALALAAWVALTDLIPAVGAAIGAAGVAAVVAFQGGGKLWPVLLLLFLYQMVENYLIAPRVMRRAVDLNPATVIVALMVGGSLAGLVGALLALPVAAMIKVVVFELLVPERLDQVRKEAALSGYTGRKLRRRRELP